MILRIFIPSPIPAFSKTPQANQTALVKFNDSSFCAAAAASRTVIASTSPFAPGVPVYPNPEACGPVWNLPKGENLSSKYRQIATT